MIGWTLLSREQVAKAQAALKSDSQGVVDEVGLLALHLSLEQRDATFVRAESKKKMSVAAAIRWYVLFISKDTKQLLARGAGIFRLDRP